MLDASATTATHELIEIRERIDRILATMDKPTKRRGRPTTKPKIKVGDDGTTAELREAITFLITERPRSLRTLLRMTGARRSRVSGVLVKMQVDGLQVKNAGTPRRAKWSLTK